MILKQLLSIAFAMILLSPAYAIDEQMILEQLEQMGKKESAFPLAYQLAQKQNNYDNWHIVAKKYEDLDQYYIAYLQTWKKAKQINTQETYEKFLELRPHSMFNLWVISQIFELVKAKNSIEEYAKFIEKFGEKFPSIEVIEAFYKIQELSFEKAKQINTVEIFDAFIQTFPDAPQTKEVIELAFNLAKRNLEQETMQKTPEELENMARILFNEARKMQKTLGCASIQTEESKECNYSLFISVERKYQLLNLPIFNVTKTVTEALDREERLAFENALLNQQKRIETSINDMKTKVVNILKEQNKLLGEIADGQKILIQEQKELKTMLETHHKRIEERLNQVEVNLGGLNVDLNHGSLNFRKVTPKGNGLLSKIVSTGLNFVPYGSVIKVVTKSLSAVYGFIRHFI